MEKSADQTGNGKNIGTNRDRLSPVRSQLQAHLHPCGAPLCPAPGCGLHRVLDAAEDAELQHRAPPGGRGGATSPCACVRACVSRDQSF